MRRGTTLQSNRELENTRPRILVYDYHQDDPQKCTSAKLQKFHLVSPLHSLSKIPFHAIVLNPASSRTLSMEDRPLIRHNGLIGLDCSWNLSDEIFEKNIRGENRRLPLLLAGNPTNYSARGKLSTAEAIAAALVITGFNKDAERILEIFAWGHTFLTLNKDPLQDYARATADQIGRIERDYFPEPAAAQPLI